jgi:hypothetical protein
MEYNEGDMIPLGQNLRDLVNASVHIEDIDEDFDLSQEQLVKAMKL